MMKLIIFFVFIFSTADCFFQKFKCVDDAYAIGRKLDMYEKNLEDYHSTVLALLKDFGNRDESQWYYFAYTFNTNYEQLWESTKDFLYDSKSFHWSILHFVIDNGQCKTNYQKNSFFRCSEGDLVNVPIDDFFENVKQTNKKIMDLHLLLDRTNTIVFNHLRQRFDAIELNSVLKNTIEINRCLNVSDNDYIQLEKMYGADNDQNGQNHSFSRGELIFVTFTILFIFYVVLMKKFVTCTKNNNISPQTIITAAIPAQTSQQWVVHTTQTGPLRRYTPHREDR